jgi:hypothetical protein
MTTSSVDADARKRQLIAEGRIYRLEVASAKAQLQEGLQAKSLAQDAMAHVASAAMQTSGKLGLGIGAMKTLLPIGLAGLSAWRSFRSARSKR